MIRKIISRYRVCAFAVIAASFAALSHPATAETVGAVTQTTYNYTGQPVCVAVRMNPSAYGSLPASACDLGAQGSEGPDRITKTSYDNSGQVKQIRQAVGTSAERAYSTFAYSANGNLTDSIDANGNRTKLTYDGHDRLVGLYHPSTTRSGAWNPVDAASALSSAGTYSTTDYESYVYDNNGNRTWWRRRDGNVIEASYDNLNRKTIEWNGSNLIRPVYTTYDGFGRVLKKRFDGWNGDGVTYTYDGLGRLQTAADRFGRTLTYTYNQASARQGMWWPDSKLTYYGYDALNRLTYTDISNSGVATSLGYDSFGRLNGRGRANNTSTAYGYDFLGRMADMNHYFPAGGDNVYWHFDYNPASQVKGLTSNNTDKYEYKVPETATDNRTYDGLNRDASIAAMPNGYDARGNLKNDGRAMDYDLFNRLLTVTGGPESANLQLSYDPEGRLESYTSNGATRYFLYDGTRLIAEYDSPTNMLMRYMHGLGTDDPWAESTGSAVSSANTKYLYPNYQGSIFAQANGSGAITDIYAYGPYGEPLVKNVANTNQVTKSFWGTRFRYTGQTTIPEAQLYYYKARVYDPNYGRFLQTDPIGSKDDLNLYGYVGGDPINASDPTGLAQVCNPWGCHGTASPETRQKQAEFAKATGHNNAPGTTITVSTSTGGNLGPANASEAVGIAVDDTGKTAVLETKSIGVGNSAGARGQTSVTITVANGRIQDQTGDAVTAQGGGGVVTGGASVAQNSKGETVTAVTIGLGTPSTPGGSVGASRTTELPSTSNPEVDEASRNVPMSCPHPNSCIR